MARVVWRTEEILASLPPPVISFSFTPHHRIYLRNLYRNLLHASDEVSHESACVHFFGIILYASSIADSGWLIKKIHHKNNMKPNNNNTQ